MSDPQQQPVAPDPDPANPDLEGEPSSGPNLALLYSLIALALAAAIGLAMMIVFPFHHRR
jgi:hypothetical protein